MGCLLLSGTKEVGTASQREIYALLLGRNGEEGRELFVSVDSQLPATQNILMAKWNILEWHILIPFISIFTFPASRRKMVYSGSFSPHLKDSGWVFFITSVLKCLPCEPVLIT